MFKDFSEDFYWGASTSAHQVEGGLENNWSKWEPKHANLASEEMKEKRPWYMSNDQNYIDACSPDNYISGEACDSYHRYMDDIEVMKELGLNAYRFSVDWSRIEPVKGEFSEEGIEYYKSLVKELRSNDIEPFLTCWHWTIPLWLEEEGGLESKDVVEHFRKYVKFLVENLGDDVLYWITINEPIVISTASYLIGTWPPQKRNPLLFNEIGYNTLVDMHKEAYLTIKEYNEDLQVSIAKNNRYVEACNDWFFNKGIASVYRYFNNFRYLDRVKDYLDFIGLNYYFHHKIGVRGFKDDNDRLNDMGWYMDPRSIYFPIKELWNRYHLPIYITENGVADREDQYRQWWLDETIDSLIESINEGVDIRGYMHWSLLDNFEWADGFWPRFGLVEVDRKTFDRRIKKSGYYYKELIKRVSGEGE
jgi:beta-glucosidase